jgi:uncharacterized membrane protein YkoI
MLVAVAAFAVNATPQPRRSPWGTPGGRLSESLFGARLAFGVSAKAKEQMGEKIELNSRPAAVQQTIKETAAGGEVVRVKREDDPHGKWNYEAIANTNGKEWRFEVDPNGSKSRPEVIRFKGAVA